MRVVQRIAEPPGLVKLISQLGAALRSGDCERVEELLVVINALALPRMFVSVTAKLLHLVIITSAQDGFVTRGVSNSCFLAMDVVWSFDPLTGIWDTVRDRTGLFSPLCPIKSGGCLPTMPMVPLVGS